MADSLLIADAVVSELNGSSLAILATHPELAFTAERKPVPVVARTALTTCHVTVCPGDSTEAILTRGSTVFEHTVEIGVQFQLADLEAAHADPLYDLCDQMADFLRRIRLADFPTAAWLKTERGKPLQEHLDQFRVFTSVLKLTYQHVR